MTLALTVGDKSEYIVQPGIDHFSRSVEIGGKFKGSKVQMRPNTTVFKNAIEGQHSKIFGKCLREHIQRVS